MDSNLIFDKSLSFINQFLSIYGFGVLDNDWNKINRRIFRVITTCILASPTYGMYQYFKYNYQNVTLISDLVALSVGLYSTIIKLIIFMMYTKDNLRNLIETSIKFRQKYSQNTDIEEIALKNSKLIFLAIKLIYGSYLVACFLLLLVPVFSWEYYRLPMVFMQVFVEDSSPYYEVNYITQIFITFTAINVIFGIDGCFVLFISEACFHIDVMKYYCSKMGKTKETSSKKYIDEVIQIYTNFLEYVSELHNLFAMFMIIVLGYMIPCISMSMYTLSTTSDMVIIQKTLTYVAGAVVQMFTYCWCGQFLTSKSHELTTFIYEGQWYDLQIAEQKSLVIVMLRSQRPIKLKAALVDISLETFITILKTAYSWFTIIAA